MQPHILLPASPVIPVFLGDAVFERVVGLGLDEQVSEGLENGADLGGGLPDVGLEQTEADAAEGVVGDVGVVDAGQELDDGGLEGVVGGQGKEDAEAARVVGRVGGRSEGDVPGVDGRRGRERHGEALGGFLGDLGVLLEGRWLVGDVGSIGWGPTLVMRLVDMATDSLGVE